MKEQFGSKKRLAQTGQLKGLGQEFDRCELEKDSIVVGWLNWPEGVRPTI